MQTKWSFIVRRKRNLRKKVSGRKEAVVPQEAEKTGSIEDQTMNIQNAYSFPESFGDEETELLTSIYLELEC